MAKITDGLPRSQARSAPLSSPDRDPIAQRVIRAVEALDTATQALTVAEENIRRALRLLESAGADCRAFRHAHSAIRLGLNCVRDGDSDL